MANQNISDVLQTVHWASVRGRNGSGVFHARIRMPVVPRCFTRGYGHVLELTWRFAPAPTRAMPDESDGLGEFEDRFREAVEHDATAILTAVRTSDGVRQWVYYTGDPEVCCRRLKKIESDLQRDPPHPLHNSLHNSLQVSSEADPKWKRLHDDILTGVVTEKLTWIGRALLLATIMIVAVAAYVGAGQNWEARSPRFLFVVLVLPAVAIGLLVYFGGRSVFDRLGYPIYRIVAIKNPGPACPQCSTGWLEPHDEPSMLDGNSGMRCVECGWTRPPERLTTHVILVVLSALAAVVCLLVIVSGLGETPMALGTLVAMGGFLVAIASVVWNCRTIFKRSKSVDRRSPRDEAGR